MLEQNRDVLRMFAQRRNDQTDDVEAIEQIAAERFGSHPLERISTGCGHESRTAVCDIGLEDCCSCCCHSDGERLDPVNEERPVPRLRDRLNKSPDESQ